MLRKDHHHTGCGMRTLLLVLLHLLAMSALCLIQQQTLDIINSPSRWAAHCSTRNTIGSCTRITLLGADRLHSDPAADMAKAGMSSQLTLAVTATRS